MPKTVKQPENFETGFAELEALISQLESGNLALEASLTAWQRGQELLQYCEGKLADAERQLKVLEGDRLQALKVDGDSA
ncbi:MULTISPECIES: exodeoxyribonuclease VII small subunit [Silvimonas]|uniref:exodeoxyribonuclease VII small subunit n=1 Tax=Silvimonas TaxID=300264 RepID=UPI0024B3AFE8|nr:MULTISPECIES: exodeoxyribonuclease VII small subunit [Silvimonas]MDR3427929.1 exodeoxyribonuclease VII small subunit [Silvimonas sp.]